MNKLINTVQTEFEMEHYEIKDEKLISENQKLTSNRGISLTSRDYEVLKFLLEMKFASEREICFKFFRNCHPEKGQVNNTYTIKRLVQLEKEGFIKSTKAFDASKRLFYATSKSFRILRQIYPEYPITKPSNNIDGRTVVHDYYLLILRLKLESEKNISSWISDRTLKNEKGPYELLGSAHTPDGVYTNEQNERVALELEVSVKSKARYQEKIRKYVSFIRAQQNNPKVFKKVHYVVFSDITFRLLETYSSLYKNLFTIELASNYNLKNGLLI